MVKSNAKKPNSTTETYSVIIDGQPVPVEASSLDEAIKKAQGLAAKSDESDEEGN